MLKYVSHIIGFRELPDEVALCVSISGCTQHCKGCHSPELWEDTGTDLTWVALKHLIENSDGITALCLMGGDTNWTYLKALFIETKIVFPDLKIGWYSGKSNDIKDYDDIVDYVDYLKIGPYDEKLGPLDEPTTNQKLYRVYHIEQHHSVVEDITHKFWREIK